MISIGSLALLSPWYLLALVILPVLWHIVRFTPPAPRRIPFPAVKMLKFLLQKEESPRRAPWWLLLLRLMMVVLIILAAAQPVLNPDTNAVLGNSTVIVVDNGWNAAAVWGKTQSESLAIIAASMRAGKPVQIITTAPNPDSPFGFASNAGSAAEAAQIVKGLRPLPWPQRYDLLDKELDKDALPPNPDIYWFSDGATGEGQATVINRLRQAGRVTFYLPQELEMKALLARPLADDRIELQIRRASVAGRELTAAEYNVQAFDQQNRVIGQQTVVFEGGKNSAKSVLELPYEIKNKISKLSIENTASAATTYLLDETGRQHPVGIITGQAMDSSKPLLDEHYFIERAISPFANIYRGNVQELIKTGVSAIIMTDANIPADLDRDELQRWVERGGTLIRFAGENMIKSNDPLTPVPIRDKPRSLIGNLAWSEPLGLAAIPDHSPFAGLSVPPDVKIRKQLLSVPTPDLPQKSWLNLSDGTPIITGMPMGKGHLALFHIAASDHWSNLILSGFFVELLQRLIWLSQGIIAASPDATLTVHEMLDGFGILQSPPSFAKSIAADELQIKRAGPFFPPGYYGSSGDKKAFNLSDHMPAIESIGELPSDIAVIQNMQNRETDLRPWIYLLTLLLALADSFISLNLRGFIPNLRGFGGACILAAAIISAAMPAMAEPNHIEAARHLRLAYVKTFSSEADRISQAGLFGLSDILRNRTAVHLSDPVGLDIDRDELAFYPFLYWPLVPGAPPISPTAAQKVNHYLKNGGMIVIDTRDGSGSAIAQNSLAEYFRLVEIPALNPISKDHVLLRSFYLLKQWPGRWTDDTLWMSGNEDSYFDGVSPVIVGTQDWAAAWAADKNGKPLIALNPGGESQREYARRFGVNMVLYALTGNYKADQVHVPAILERLNDGQNP